MVSHCRKVGISGGELELALGLPLDAVLAMRGYRRISTRRYIKQGGFISLGSFTRFYYFSSEVYEIWVFSPFPEFPDLGSFFTWLFFDFICKVSDFGDFFTKGSYYLFKRRIRNWGFLFAFPEAPILWAS